MAEYKPGDFKGQKEAGYDVELIGKAGDNLWAPTGTTTAPLDYRIADWNKLNATGINTWDDRMKRLYEVSGPESGSSTSGDSLTRVNDMLSKLGLSTAQSDDARRQEIMNQEAEARKARASAAESIFGQKLARAETVGEEQLRGSREGLGQNIGFAKSSTAMAFMNSVQKNIEDKMDEIKLQKQAYIDEGNWEASKRADDALRALDERDLNILLKKAEWAMDLDKQATATDLDIANLQLKIPAGQSVNIGGVDYTGLAADEGIFKGSDLVNLMKNIPAGSTQEITDPATGTTYTLSGLGTGNVNIATDDRGYQYGIDKSTGQTLWKSAQPVGKTKTQAGSTTINMGTFGEQPVLAGGKQYFRRVNTKTNETFIVDINGNKVDPKTLPADALVVTGTAFNPDAEEDESWLDKKLEDLEDKE